MGVEFGYFVFFFLFLYVSYISGLCVCTHFPVCLCSIPLADSLSRLLDASVVQAGRNLDLTLVLEYVDQDLSTYLSKVPASGLSRDCVKV